MYLYIENYYYYITYINIIIIIILYYFVNFQKQHNLSYSSMASLMIIGGFDNRPRIGGNILIKGETEGWLV